MQYYAILKNGGLMFDIHCHICYGCDDGAEDLETAVEMVRLAGKSGTKGIAATPHCNVPGSYSNKWGRELSSKVDNLRNEVSRCGIDVRIYSGQEIFCTDDTVKQLKNGNLITLNFSRYPLVEFDFFEYSQSVYKKLNALVAEGYIPVVAHPERYAFVCEDENAAAVLKSIGCLLQINKGSLEGRFGKDAFDASHSIIARSLADAVASDAHSPYMRTADMSQTHEIICEDYSYDYAELLLTTNPMRILNNQETFTD
jgi:protein-tyrosine phosphatase